MRFRLKRVLGVAATIGLAATLVPIVAGPADAAPGAQGATAIAPFPVATRTNTFSLTNSVTCDGTGAAGWRAHTFIVNTGVDPSTLDFSVSGAPAGYVGIDFDSSNGSIAAPLYKGSEDAGANFLPATSPAGFVAGANFSGFNFDPSVWTLTDGDYQIGIACVDGPGVVKQWWTRTVRIDASPSTGPFMSAPPSVSIGDATIVEGNSSKAPLGIRVTLSQKLTAQASVDYTVTSGSATVGTKPTDPGIDAYSKASGTIVFKLTGSGLTGVQKNISINTLGDTTVEPNESFTITLSNPVGITLGKSVGTATLIDDDSGSGLQVSVGDAALVEGNADKTRTLQVPVSLSDVPTGTTTVVWTLTAGTATPGAKPTTVGADLYGKTTGTLSWDAGKPRRKFVTSPILADTLVEGNETYTVTLSSPSGATISRSVGTGTIINDD